MKVAVCDYRAGNIRSVEIALRRLGAEMADDVAGADLAVLPGVGSARSAMDELRRQGLDEALRRARSPTGGRCSASASASSSRSTARRRTAASTGLGLLPGTAVRLKEGRVPRIGWAEVDGDGVLLRALVRASETPAATAWSEGIVAEARSGSFLGVQFHPEKSGAAGARYLDRVLAEVREQSLSRA